jgi:hypothetical protein
MERAILMPVPETRSSGSEYPRKPLKIDRIKRLTPMIQLISRGRRKPPVKKMRHMWTTMAPRKMLADQWCIWRMRSPARTEKLRLTVEA